MESIKGKVSAVKASARQEFEKAVGPHAAMLAKHAQIVKSVRDKQAEAAVLARSANDLEASDEFKAAQKIAGDKRQPLTRLESAEPFVGLFDVLAKNGWNTLPAQMFGQLAAVPVVGKPLSDELGKLFPSSKDGKPHAKLTEKVVTAINAALTVLNEVANQK